VVQGHDHPWLLSSSLQAQQLSWVAGEPPVPGAYQAKTRYRQSDAACELDFEPVVTVGTQAAMAVRFTQPQWAVTPGQSVVLYAGDVCLGGGVIASAQALVRYQADQAAVSQ